MRDLRSLPFRRDEALICALGGGAGTAAGDAAIAAANIASATIAAGAATHAADLAQKRYDTTRSDLLPYNTGGQADFTAYNQMGPFNFNPTMGQLEETPGYQFALTQGLKGVQNSATARGLGVSGAAQKGAANFATGLASQTYQNMFQNALSGYQTNANKLLQGANLGENAGAMTGNVGANLASTQAQSLISAGNSLGGGINSAGSILSGAIGNMFSGAFGGGGYNPQDATGQYIGNSGLTDNTNPNAAAYAGIA